MSNRRKMKDNRLRLKRTEVFKQGLAKVFLGEERENIPTHDEVFTAGEAEMDRYVPGMPEDEIAKMSRLTAPISPEPVLKVVPAKHKGTRVGDAFIHDDGQVTVVFDEDAPKWALDEILEFNSGAVGYSIGTKDDDGSS